MRRDELRPGTILRIDAAASVQFGPGREINFRVIRVLEREMYSGWCWLVGYQLNAKGEAVERREIFVQYAGLRPAYVPSWRGAAAAPSAKAAELRSGAVFR